jgi:hypothetical protein
MNKFGSLFGAAILALASLPVNAGLMVYTDRASWEGAVFGLFQTEEFDNRIANDKSIRFESGIVSAAQSSASLLNAVGPLLSPDDPRFKLEAYYGRVDKPPGRTITWTFPDQVFPDQVWGFFGDFGGLDTVGHLLNVSVGDTAFTIQKNGGWGVLADSSADLFSEVAWTSLVSQSFTIDDFSYTGAGSSPVPAPPALWLFVAGLLGLIGFNRRSKAA